MCFWVDSTFELILKQLEGRINFNKSTIELGHSYDALAYDKVKIAFFASDWAARSAINHYNLKPEKAKVVPFGANLDSNLGFEEIKSIISNRVNNNIINIIFSAANWEQKNGDLVVKIVNKLNLLGYPTKLNIIGNNHFKSKNLPPYINSYGFISKNSKNGLQLLKQLFSEAHFLIIPSKQEAYGITFCEANAFGVPVFGNDIGGVSTIINNGINGYLVNKDFDMDKVIEKIIYLFEKRHDYKELALSSFNEYKTRLNWFVSCGQVKKLIKEMI